MFETGKVRHVSVLGQKCENTVLSQVLTWGEEVISAGVFKTSVGVKIHSALYFVRPLTGSLYGVMKIVTSSKYLYLNVCCAVF